MTMWKLLLTTAVTLSMVSLANADYRYRQYHGGGHYRPYPYPTYPQYYVIPQYDGWIGIRPGFQPWRLYHRRDDGYGY